MNREKELERSLRKVLSVFSRLVGIYDSKEATKIIREARKLLGDIPNKKTKAKIDILENYSCTSCFDINLVCKKIEETIPICLGGGSGVRVKLKEVDTISIIAELYELFGENLLIDFIKNG